MKEQLEERYKVEKLKWNKLAGKILEEERLPPNISVEEYFLRSNILRPVISYFGLMDRDIKNLTLLDYGCGIGTKTIALSRKVARVIAIDVAINRVQVLSRRIKAASITNVFPINSDCEHLPFVNDSFDLVFGCAILHHLRIDKALFEIRRVLKPGGKAAFCEPLAYNPIVNLFRHIKHNYILNMKGTDRPLTKDDKKHFLKYFSKVSFLEVSLFSDRLPWLAPLERKIIEILPTVGRLACYGTILVEKG